MFFLFFQENWLLDSLQTVWETIYMECLESSFREEYHQFVIYWICPEYSKG